jgi:hypothetical protein
MSHWTRDYLASYLLSLPERVLRSATGLAAGVLREIGEVTIPRTVRRSHLYQNLVEAILRFMIEEIGQVQSVYPKEELISEHFLLRRAAGNGIELIGILAFRASPVWVLAALADASGAGRNLIREITKCLKDEGLLDPGRDFVSVDQLLDGLEASAGHLAATINMPPLDMTTLRQEWESVRRALSRIPPRNLPSLDVLRSVWTDIKNEAREQNRTVFQISSLMAMSAVADLPQKTRWISASARLAAVRTGSVVASVILEHYRTTLQQIHETGYMRYAVRRLRPYVYGAVSQFSPKRNTLTERLFQKRKGSKK